MSAPEVSPPAEILSPAEVAFERLRRRAGLYVAPVAAIAVWLFTTDTPAHRLAALMTCIGILWITEALPVAATALLAPAGAVLLGVAGAEEAFRAFGSPLLFLFVGSFLLAEAMQLHGLGERFARAVLSLVRSRRGAVAAVAAGSFALSLWISNTAATAVWLPIALSIARAARDRRFAAALVLAVAYGASVGGIGTPVGTPPNLIGIKALAGAGIELGFVRWMSVGVPIGLVMLSILVVLLGLRFGIGGDDLARGPVASGDPRPWSRAERATAAAFTVAVVLWVLPGILELLAPNSDSSRWTKVHLPEPVAGLVAAALLFLWPIAPAGAGEIGPRRALTWEQATRIDWGTILLFGAGILLGELATRTGLAAEWGGALIEVTGSSSLWGITALVTAASIVLSELTNNTATANLMLPLTLSLAAAAGIPPGPPAHGATQGASFGFMLPISTAPNAMAYGTGQISVRQMMSAGVLFDVLGYLAILGGLRLLCPLLGLA
jgi:sodium-dependent dicarboxylate transporter 2/3/5